MIKNALGDYAKTTDFDTFLKRAQPGGIRTDLARLVGARFVASIEVDDGREIAQGLFKRLTGGDEQTARGLYTSEVEMPPTSTFWLVANSAPIVDAADGAMWRRILRIPFPHTVPLEHRDPNVKKALTTPSIGGPAVLAWIVEGCLEWQRIGLAVPESVSEATAQMRAESDPVRDFLDDLCLLDPSNGELSVPVAKLWEAYTFWSRRSRPERGLTRRNFGDAMLRRGAVRARGTGGTWLWRGVALTSPDFEPLTGPRGAGQTPFGAPHRVAS